MIGDVTRRLRLMYDKEMKEQGLSRAQWRALIYIIRLESPSQTELATALDIGRATTGALIDQLEARGFVARATEPMDRRIWRVVPTKTALQNLSKLNDAAIAVSEKVLNGLSKEEILLMWELLSKLKDNLEM